MRLILKFLVSPFACFSIGIGGAGVLVLMLVYLLGEGLALISGGLVGHGLKKAASDVVSWYLDEIEGK